MTREMVDGDGNAATFSTATGGMLLGPDALLSDWRIGLIAGYSHSEFDVPDRASSRDGDNYHLGAFSGTEWSDVAFRLGAIDATARATIGWRNAVGDTTPEATQASQAARPSRLLAFRLPATAR